MIVPCIDLVRGRAVQLIGGEAQALDGGDPLDLVERLSRVGEIAIVDIDAARGEGDNSALIEQLVRRAPCRVGGGIRTADDAIRWLDAGATKVVLGTAARPDVLRQLPRDRVIAALDADRGEVVVEGWRTRTGADVFERLDSLAEFVDGFLVTQVEREGRMVGADLKFATALRDRCDAERSLTFAGGITSVEDIAALDRLDIDAQVGMAIYTGALDLADAFAAPLHSDRDDGLWPTVVVDETERALGLCWSSARSLRAAVQSGKGVYESRRRGLWVKGETSGATQHLLRVEADCDRDALRFVVRQAGAGFCHRDTATCWGPNTGLAHLERRLSEVAADAPTGSYTARLLADETLLRSKLREEAGELADARDADHVAEEAADLLYFTAVALARSGVSFAAAERVLDQRARKVTRRPGDAKEDA